MEGEAAGLWGFPTGCAVPSSILLLLWCILLRNCGWHLAPEFTKLFRKAERYTENALARGVLVRLAGGTGSRQALFGHDVPLWSYFLWVFCGKPWPWGGSARKMRGF